MNWPRQAIARIVRLRAAAGTSPAGAVPVVIAASLTSSQ